MVPGPPIARRRPLAAAALGAPSSEGVGRSLAQGLRSEILTAGFAIGMVLLA
jgi:hypothetical protein